MVSSIATLPSLLIVDDDPLIRESLRLSLSDAFDIYLAESRASAVSVLRDMPVRPQLALVDLGLPPVPHRPDEGFRLITELLAHDPAMKILVLSGQNEEAHARQARTLGAMDFIAKPCPPHEIRKQLHNAALFRQVDRETGQAPPPDALYGIVGQSPPIQSLRRQIELYASTPFPVLIEGESGSGKERVAGAIQQLGSLRSAPYLVFNCAAVSPTLVEPTLFGYAKGAFTGAHSAKPGFFEDAGTGTLFLDEIGELPPELQPKLLRVLENGEFQRVGETATRTSRARIIAATNLDLRQAIQSGRFRTDLYHRLSVFTIHVPPLRELGTDKLLLLHYFRDFYSAQAKCAPFELDASARKRWEQYSFPGNTRELRNIVIRLVTKYPGLEVSAAQLEMEFGPTAATRAAEDAATDQEVRAALQQPDFNLSEALLRQERRYIEAALQLARNNISEAARMLGIQRTTLYSRLEAVQKHKAEQSAAKGYE